jgi:hypothetical protein
MFCSIQYQCHVFYLVILGSWLWWTLNYCFRMTEFADSIPLNINIIITCNKNVDVNFSMHDAFLEQPSSGTLKFERLEISTEERGEVKTSHSVRNYFSLWRSCNLIKIVTTVTSNKPIRLIGPYEATFTEEYIF